MRPLMCFGLCFAVFVTGSLEPPRARAQVCPAVTGLTLTCGDGTCGLGESTTNCVVDCVDRNTRAVAYYAEYSDCPASLIYRPESIAELQLAVRELVAQNRRVKFMGSGHSTAGNFCSDGGVIITEALDGISEIEVVDGHDTVVVEAGVTFTQLTDHLAARGKWLGYTVVGFGPINVLGGVATGVHGSYTHGTSALSSRIVSLDLVRPDGTIVTRNAGNTSPDEWRALRANLGALGGVVRARFTVDDIVNLRGFSEEIEVTQSIVTEDIDALVTGCDYAFLMFYPANDEWVRFCGEETTDPVTDPGTVNYLFSPDVTPFESAFFQTSAQLSACTPSLEPFFESQALTRMATSPICIPDGAGGCDRVNDAVGPGHRMLTIDRFPETQPRFSQYDYEFSVRYEDAAEILNYIDQRFDSAGRGMPLVGTVVRFDEVRDDTLFGVNAVRPGLAVGDRIVHIEMPFYRPYSFTPTQLANYTRPYDDVMRFVATNFPEAQFHFGKNTRELLAMPEHRALTTSRLARFQAVVNAWDPYGVFSNDYLETIGLTWPLRGQPFSSVYITGDVATSAHTRIGSVFAIQSRSSSRCLNMVGEPGLFLDGSIFGVHPAETRSCTGALTDENPRARFLVRDVASGQFVEALERNRRYSIHPEDNPFAMCLDSVWGLTYRFAACNGSTAQQFMLELDASGTGRIVAQNNTVGGCMNDMPFVDGVNASFCSPWSNPASLRWSFIEVDERRMPRVPGMGGDPYWIDRLAIEGLNLATVSTATLPSLAARINNPSYVVYRQRVVDNTSGAPAPGFEVCALDAAGNPLHGADGREFACAFTDSNGYYTMLGLPANTDLIHVTSHKGYLESAIVFSSTYSGWFEQEYTGTGSFAAASLGLNIDSRFPFTSGFGVRPGYGDASLTVLNEVDAVGSRGYGVTEVGDYAGNGTGNATFALFMDDGSGTFSIPYPDLVGNRPGVPSGPDGIPDGLKYLAPSTNPLFGGSEVPSNTRTTTYAPYGGAIVFSLPDGEYEAEVHHPTLSCYPGLDAWPGANADRARFRVVEGHMSDVRFFCE
jgi:L-gulonolactone oxidase